MATIQQKKFMRSQSKAHQNNSFILDSYINRKYSAKLRTSQSVGQFISSRKTSNPSTGKLIYSKEINKAFSKSNSISQKSRKPSINSSFTNKNNNSFLEANAKEHFGSSVNQMLLKSIYISEKKPLHSYGSKNIFK